MASFAAIAAVAKSVERLLQARFVDEEPVAGSATKALVIRSEDMRPDSTAIVRPCVTLLFYCVEANKHMRAPWSAVGHVSGRGHLPLDLRFLLTPWAGNAEHEHRILGRAMEVLEASPILSGPMLHPSDTWSASESVQVVLDDMSPESVLRVFENLPGDYRLSVPYIARVVRISTRPVSPDLPASTVVAGLTPECA